MNAHTPGPWRLEPKFALILGPEKQEICAIHAGFQGEKNRVNRQTAWANAKLIAASPDLLAACQAVYSDPYTTCACAEKVKAAIAKALGQ